MSFYLYRIIKKQLYINYYYFNYYLLLFINIENFYFKHHKIIKIILINYLNYILFKK